MVPVLLKSALSGIGRRLPAQIRPAPGQTGLLAGGGAPGPDRSGQKILNFGPCHPIVIDISLN